MESTHPAMWPGLGPHILECLQMQISSAYLVDVCGVSILNHGRDEATVWHGHSQGDIDVLIVCDAIAVSGAGCMHASNPGLRK